MIVTDDRRERQANRIVALVTKAIMEPDPVRARQLIDASADEFVELCRMPSDKQRLN
jgi:hypothetical protein